MSRIFSRPMFKRGGSAGQGITSGLAPTQRLGFKDGLSTQQRLLGAVGQRPSGIYDFLTDWGLRMASATPKGNVLQTAAAEAIDPYEKFVKGKQGEENLLRQVALEAEGIDIKAEQAALAAEAEGKLKKELLRIRGKQQKELYEIEKGENLDAMILEKAATDMSEQKYNNWTHAKNAAEWTFRGSQKYQDRRNGGVLTIEYALPGKKQTKFLKNQIKKNGPGTIYYDPFGDRVLEIAHGEDGPIFKPVEGGSEDTVIETKTTEDVVLSRSDAHAEARHRGLELLPEPPEGAPRGWLTAQKRNNPKAITLFELQEILKKEKFHERYKNIKKQKRGN